MKSIKVCEYSRSRSFHDDLILQDQASDERSQDQWSSGFRFTKKKSPLHAQASLFLSNHDDVEALVAMVTSLHEGEKNIAQTSNTKIDK